MPLLDTSRRSPRASIRSLRALGVQIAIDDFASGLAIAFKVADELVEEARRSKCRRPRHR